MSRTYYEKAKISVPYLDDTTVERERLFEIFRKSLKGKMIFISAPAGYGKTTALANWIKAEGVDCAWLSLDEQDNEPMRLLKYLCRSIDRVIPGTYKHIAETGQDARLAFERLFLLLQDIDSELLIVLEDYHLITSDIAISAVSYFLSNKLPYVNIIITSRSHMPEAYDRLLLSQEMELIRQHQLLFTKGEIKAFFSNKQNKIDQNTVKSLMEKTEGWPLGVVAFSLGRLIFNMNDDNSSQKMESYICSFIEKEIFSRFSPQEQRFMVETSILNEFSLISAAAVAGFSDSEEIIKILSKKCALITELGVHEKKYRYHHMYREFLRTKLKEQDAAHVNSLYSKAGEHYKSLGDNTLALSYFMVSDKNKVIELISSNCAGFLLSVEHNKIISIIDSLADYGVFENLRVCICYSWALQYTIRPKKSKEFLAYLEDLFEKRKNSLSKSEQKKIRLELDAMSFPFVVAEKDYEKTLSCLKGMFLSTVSDPIAFNLNTVRQMYSNEYTLRDTAFGLYGRHDFFISFFDNLKASKYKLIINKVLKTNSILITQAEVYYEINQIDKAKILIVKAVEQARKRGNMKDYLPAMLCLANIQKSDGDFQGAFKTVKQCGAVLKEHRDYLGIKTLEAYKARMNLMLNDLRKLKKWEESLNISAHDDVTNVTRHALYIYLTLAMVLIKTNRYIMARLLINKIIEMLSSLQDLIYKSQVFYMDAVLTMKEGGEKMSAKKAEKAFRLGMDNMYLRTYTDFGHDLPELINAWRQSSSDDSKLNEYVDKLEKISDEYISKTDNIKASSGDRALTKREREILLYISRNLTNQEIANELFVSVQTVKNHTGNIYKKLGISNRTQAIAMINKNGIDSF